ncbi:MAG TPA: porin [Myxococcota bacterium]|nr:porin [Myxococcota bacterium]
MKSPACILAVVVCVSTLLPVSPAQAGQPELVVVSDDGDSSISFHLVLQLRWEYAYIEGQPGGDHYTQNRISFRRLRPVIMGNILTSDLSYLLHLNLAPGALELMDLWLDYRFHPTYSLRVGQMKIPFTRYRQDSFKDLPLPDWSGPTRYFGAERQVGLMVHNGVGHPGVFEYQLGFFTGVNARAANGIGLSLAYAEPISSPSSLVNPDGRLFSEMHSEIAAHLAWNAAGIDTRRPTDFEGGPARFSLGMSAAWDLDPTPREDMRLRLAPEAVFKAHGFAAWAVLMAGFGDHVMDSVRYAPAFLGSVLQASYLFFESYEIGLRYTLIDYFEGLRDDTRAYAAAEVQSASDPAEIDELGRRFALVGKLIREHEVNLGFNWYLMGRTLKWQVDAGLLVTEQADGTRSDIRLRTQIQLAF